MRKPYIPKGLCDEWIKDYDDALVRVRELEAEVARYKSDIDTTEAATGMSGIYAKLEAERDRLKGELEYQKTIEEQLDVINEGLRARHAALVEAADKTLNEVGHERYCDANKGPEDEQWLVEEDCHCVFKELKAALAEVKK